MGRKSKVDQSKHADEIAHLLIDLRWGSGTVSKYLELKYGEHIPASTLRTWRGRRLKTLERYDNLPDIWKTPDDVVEGSAEYHAIELSRPKDELPDVLSRRMALIAMQEARVRIDLEHELSMGKLFSSQSKEINLLNNLYDSAKTDMQDLGLWPSREAGPETMVNVQAVAQAEAKPQETSKVHEILDGVDREDLTRLGRVLTLARRQEITSGESDAG